MRVHGDKRLRRRDGVPELRHYQDAKEILKEDFHNTCGYCGKDSGIMRERFHADHFVPVKLAPERENDYYNLVLACPKCNLVKSKKWPTGDKMLPHDEYQGFIDPTSDEFDEHIERTSDGYIIGKTPLGKNMCENLNFHVRRTDLYWKISHMYRVQRELEALYDANQLEETEKNFYIESNRLLREYIDEAFAEGE